MAKHISLNKLIHYWPLYLFVLPSIVLVATFAYFPAMSAMYHSFFRWNGDYINTFVGMQNFNKIMGSPLLWVVSFISVLLLLNLGKKTTRFSTVIKWITGIIAGGINLVYQISSTNVYAAPESFIDILTSVIVGIIAMGLMVLVVDKEADNRSTKLTVIGMMIIGFVLMGIGFMGIFAWTLLLFVAGLYFLTPQAHRQLPQLQGLRITQSFATMMVVFWALAKYAGGDQELWKGFTIISILIVANLVKILPSMVTAVVIHRLKSEAANYWYRVLFVIPMIIPGMVYLLLWKFFFEPDSVFNMVLHKLGIMKLLYLIDYWVQGGAFLGAKNLNIEFSISELMMMAENAAPVWLGAEELVLPAFILWGFPWVGVVGVLIYLAGLQSIDQSVYEAGDLDGISAVGKFWHIEFPLILTQVRINLVLMIISTLQMYGMILILFGDAGGPNGKLMVPGLYMFRNAFTEGYAGYACAVGLVIFMFILMLTELNNKYVRVEK